MTKLLPKLLLAAASAALLLILAANPALARVSLANLDAKLDQILGALGNIGVITPSVEFINVREARLFTNDGQRSQLVLFTVPADKILVVDHTTNLIDVVIVNPPTTELRLEAQLRGNNPGILNQLQTIPMGYMEELERTSRGTPNYLISRNVTVYFGPGDVQCVVESNFGGVDLTNGLIECTLAGRLIDAP